VPAQWCPASCERLAGDFNNLDLNSLDINSFDINNLDINNLDLKTSS
jgi:hypothetical protein